MESSRQEYQSGLPFPTPGDLADPGIRSLSPVFPYHCATWELPTGDIQLWSGSKLRVSHLLTQSPRPKCLPFVKEEVCRKSGFLHWFSLLLRALRFGVFFSFFFFFRKIIINCIMLTNYSFIYSAFLHISASVSLSFQNKHFPPNPPPHNFCNLKAKRILETGMIFSPFALSTYFLLPFPERLIHPKQAYQVIFCTDHNQMRLCRLGYFLLQLLCQQILKVKAQKGTSCGASQVVLVLKSPPANAGDPALISGSARSPGCQITHSTVLVWEIPSLMGRSLWGWKQLDMTEVTQHTRIPGK